MCSIFVCPWRDTEGNPQKVSIQLGDIFTHSGDVLGIIRDTKEYLEVHPQDVQVQNGLATLEAEFSKLSRPVALIE